MLKDYGNFLVGTMLLCISGPMIPAVLLSLYVHSKE